MNWARLYLKGIMQMDTVKAKKMYPDATFTMRVSFGNVKSYNPRDAVHYDYVMHHERRAGKICSRRL